jgi:hypothetical protein
MLGASGVGPGCMPVRAHAYGCSSSAPCVVPVRVDTYHYWPTTHRAASCEKPRVNCRFLQPFLERLSAYDTKFSIRSQKLLRTFSNEVFVLLQLSNMAKTITNKYSSVHTAVS